MNLKIISVSLDKNILKDGSENQERQKKYGALCREFHVIVLSHEKMASRKISQTVWIHSTSSPSKVRYYKDAIRFARSIGQSDLVTAQDPALTGFIAYRIARILSAKLHLQVHIDFFSPYFKKESFTNWFSVIIAKWLLPKADGIRVVSEKIKQYLVSEMAISAQKIIALPVYTDIKKIQEAPVLTDLHTRYPQFKTIILMVSRLVKQKNIGLAISAVGKVVDGDPSIGLVILGNGPEKEHIESQIISGGLKNNIILEPWTADAASYYKTSNIFLSTSNYEGWGRTAVEAMAAGCPIAITDVGLAGELVHNNKEALIVPVNDRGTLVKALQSLVNGPDLGRSLTANALESLKGLPSEEQSLKIYLESWQNCFS